MPLRVICHVLLALATFSFPRLAAQPGGPDDALRVLPSPSKPVKSEGMLRDYVRKESHAAFARRMQRYEALKTVEAIDTYKRELRARFVESLGGFPERTPLNARVVGQLAGTGFRAEKIIYESQPGFFVSAILYLPEGNAPHPVVLLPCGHTRNGKSGYQQPAITLAQNGLAVFCF